MANSLGDMIFRLGANIDGFEKSMGTVSQRLKAIDNEAARAFSGFDRIGSRLQNVGTTLTASITAPLAGLGALALDVAGDFEASMAKIKGFGDISGASLDKLRGQALQLGKDTQFSAQQAADGMAEFASAGMKADDIYAAMPGTLQLAAAGQIKVGEAASFVSDALGQFGLSAGETGRVADVMAVALQDTKAKMGELGSTLTYVGPVAKGAGQSLEETTAAIIALDAAGIRGEKSGTGLRGVIASLVSPSTDAARYMEQLGISVAGTDGKVRPLSDIMEQFRSKLQNVGSEAERQNIIFQVFGREAGNAAQVLIDKGGPALDAIEQKLLNSNGASEKLAKTLNSGLNYSMEQFKGSVETAGIALGTALIPSATRLLAILTDVLNNAVLPAIDWFSKLPGPVQDGAIAFAAIAAAIGPLTIGFGLVLQSVGSVATAFTSAAGLATSFGSQLVKMVGNISQAISNDMVGALSGGEMWLLRFAKAAGIAAAAFSGWKLGEWLQTFTTDYKKAEAEVNKVNEMLKQHGLAVDRGAMSLKDWAEAVFKAASQLPSTEKAVADITQTTKRMNAEVKAAQEAYKVIEKRFKEGKASAEELAVAKRKLGDATSSLNPKVDQLTIGHTKLKAATKETAEEHRRATALVKQFEDGIPALVIKEYENKIKALKVEIAKFTIEQKMAELAGRDWKGQLDQNIAAAQKLGVELAQQAASKFPAYVAGLGAIKEAAAGLTAPLSEAVARGKEQFETLTEESQKSAEKQKGHWDGFSKDVSTVFTNFAQSVAKDLFDGDLSFGEKAKSMLRSLGEAVTANFIEPATKAIGDFISGAIADLLSGKGLGGVLGSIKDIGSGIGSIFGGASGATDAISGAPDLGGGGGATGGITGAISSSLSSVLTAFASVGSFITGAIGNFQNARQENTLNAIEESTRYTKIWTGEQSQSMLWCLQKLQERSIYNTASLDAIGRFASEQLGWLERIGQSIETGMQFAMAGGGSRQVTITLNANLNSSADVDSIMDEIGRRMREIGETL